MHMKTGNGVARGGEPPPQQAWRPPQLEQHKHNCKPALHGAHAPVGAAQPACTSSRLLP
jgi:hypothetical protein